MASRRTGDHHNPGLPEAEISIAEIPILPPNSTTRPTDSDLSREDDLSASPTRLAKDEEGRTVAGGSNVVGCTVVVDVTLLREWLEDEGKSLTFESENPRGLIALGSKVQSDFDFCIDHPSCNCNRVGKVPRGLVDSEEGKPME